MKKMSNNTEDGVRKTDNRDTMEFRHEVVIPNEDLPFKMFIFEGKDGNYKVSTHWHQSVEIFLVTKGTIDFYIDSHYFSLKEHQFVIVNSNQVHSIDCPYSNNTIVLQIPVEIFQLYHRETPYISFIPQSQEKNRELAALVEQMYATYDAKEYGYELKVRSQFYELLYLLLTSFREENLSEAAMLKKKHLDKLSGVTSYMREHYREEISLEDVASRFGFSSTYLSRIFARYIQVNYRTYLTDLRVNGAVRELLETDHEIGDIAMSHGFADSRAFAKAFRKRYHCLPSFYRKQKELKNS